MSIIRNFPRYSTKENVVTNNTMLLLGRIYKTDPTLFERFLADVLDQDTLQIGPSFDQQLSAGGDGIPDGMIVQPGFRIVVEAKLTDDAFWGKERYTSHFKGESTRILLTLSKKQLSAVRDQEIKAAISDFDKPEGTPGKTIHRHLTYVGLVEGLRRTAEATRTRFKIEIDELTEDYEGFLSELGLIDDEHLRMHVVPVGQTWELNLEENLYYNATNRNHSAHKFIGLYYGKQIRHIGEPNVVMIPKRQEDGSLKYTFLKGEHHFTPDRKARFERFLNDFVAEEGYGDDGGLRYHLVDKWYDTSFEKKSPGGIMGPRHCYLRDYIDDLKSDTDAGEVASRLVNREWEVG